MDNRIFNVNGRTDEMLLDTLKLVFRQRQCGRADKEPTCCAWKFDPKYGLIILWSDYGDTTVNRIPDMTATQIFPMVQAWLASDEAIQTIREGWDRDLDHDGCNGPGWRVYCEDWGHVANYSAAICAIKPVWLWYGK